MLVRLDKAYGCGHLGAPKWDQILIYLAYGGKFGD